MKRAHPWIMLGLIACSPPPDRGAVLAPASTAERAAVVESASGPPATTAPSIAPAPASTGGASSSSASSPVKTDLASEGFVRDGRCHPRAVKTSRSPAPEEATAAFRRAWNGCVATQGRADLAFVTDSMRRSEHPFRAHKEPCRKSKKRLSDLFATLSPQLRAFGEIEALERDGDCWVVDYEGGMKNEVEGILDPADLSMLFAWRIPEG